MKGEVLQDQIPKDHIWKGLETDRNCRDINELFLFCRRKRERKSIRRIFHNLGGIQGSLL